MSQQFVKMVFPDGTTFEGSGNLEVVETFEPNPLIDSASQLIGVAGILPNVDASPKGQVRINAGSSIRTFRVSFSQWEGNTGDEWGGAPDDASALSKAQTFGAALANVRIDSTSPATLSYGEYSGPGVGSPIQVVPGEVSLPVNLGERPSSFRPEIQWIEAASLEQVIHALP